ncbi:MAG: ABC transporter permease [Chloroflexi bacterium RBG_13_56_8]|nr:MAG: ABC transporter permease [Chloroflexi bacterium RBG_13_56_8]
MRAYLARRFMYMLLLFVMSSMLAFLIITLPPGDFLSHYLIGIGEQGVHYTEAELDAMRAAYGLNRPWHIQYFAWIKRIILQGDLGISFRASRPVVDMIAERLPTTLLVSIMTLIVTYTVAIPIGVYSAVRQYSIGDYLATLFGFLGASTPNFLIALVLILYGNRLFGISVGGLMSPEYQLAPWTWAKVGDIFQHLPIPLLVIGLSGTAWLMRTMRAMLLDELRKPYVQTARAKGLKEGKLLFKYPIRVALLPIVSTIGWSLPGIFSGETIVGIVLDLPTIGPMMFEALKREDMYLAASCLLFTVGLTLIGTFISDILLAWLDPRVRYT